MKSVRFRGRDYLLSILGIGFLWQLLAWAIHQPVLPGPVEVGAAFFAELFHGELAIHWLVSFWRVAAGTVLAVLTAVPAGLVLGQSKRLNQIFAPTVYLLYPVPKVVLVTVLILLLGTGDLAKIILIYLVLFFQILVLVRDQAATLRPELILSVRSLGAGRRALLRYVYLPATLPAVLTALRQSVGTAVAVLYVAESFATQNGLGYYIFLNGSTLFNYPAMYAGIIAMSLLGLSLYFGIDLIERRQTPWALSSH